MQEIRTNEYQNEGVTPSPIVLFDGVCNFCSSVVRFAISRDPDGIFRFASLQSDAGQFFLNKFGLSTDDFDSFVLIEGDRFFLRSTAVLRLCKKLNGLWPLVYLLIVIPAPIRDFIYNIVARNRYRWFGKKEECFIPSAEIRNRFF
ncbi:MAG: thiol-disulfide oxidoreductase DCC family protein [Thermodesulfobacteriota bacterium]